MTAFGDKLWTPSSSRVESSHLSRFMAFVTECFGVGPQDYPALYQWSIEEPGPFWEAVASFSGVIWQTPPEKDFEAPPPGRMRGGRWFPGGTLNFAENLLLHDDERPVITALAEGAERRTYTARELRREVTRLAAGLAAQGVGPGDRVAGVIANVPEAIIAMLATASLGAVWASCSPDFGVSGICDRLGQLEPKVVFFTTGYRYGGKTFSCEETIRGTLERLSGIRLAVAVDHLREGSHPEGLVPWEEVQKGTEGPLVFAPRAFEDPLYILFSSGTTGVPKCITHGVGGTLLQHKKELMLHGDLGEGTRLLYYTTCGWMMWNWMVSALATGASLVLYEGSPAHPDLTALWRAVEEEGVTHFGTSPKFLASCMDQGQKPREILKSGRLKTVFSTGAPLSPEQFAWVYEAVGEDLHLASISGGTDIVSCFMLGVPTMPVHAGEIQYAGLGMAIQAWDENKKSVVGQKGELVCTRPFPSMPVCFWNDPDGAKYSKAYFSHYQDQGQEVWRHGDYIEVTPRGGIIVFGRSDATLNPGGVRIGTAEIYRVVEALDQVVDSLAVGRRANGDTEIVLFVKLAPDAEWSDDLAGLIRRDIKRELTPRHLPKEIRPVRDIPYTRSGKKVEMAVTQAIHGEKVENLSALANPEAMEEYFEMGR